MDKQEIIKEHYQKIGRKGFEVRKARSEKQKGRKITNSEMMKEVRKHRVDKGIDK